jgi:hypothetical protein
MTRDELVKDYDWQEVFKYADASPARPGDSGKAYQITDVDSVVATADGENDGADWVGLFRMNDGQFLAINAGCDYTGWGCQEGGSSKIAKTKEDAIALCLTNEERERLGL